MANFKDEEKINELRERLYSRGQSSSDSPNKAGDSLPPPEKPTVATSWKTSAKKMGGAVSAAAGAIAKNNPLKQSTSPASPEDALSEEANDNNMSNKKTSRAYRKIIILSGLGFFAVAVVFSSLFFLFGSKSISGENIAIDISGPFTLGGGEAIPLQIGITNQNSVAIESATLIVSYPPNTQSATEAGKSLTVERLPLDIVNPGETLNIPLRAVIFGEENDERIISAEIEYRVQGSNSIFAKEAEPLRFKISSSPVVLSVDSLKKISSGQEMEIVIKVSSNSATDLKDILVKADYPAGFDFTKSDPSPVSGENVWQIDELLPGEDASITLNGIVVGKETDEYAMHYSVGVSNDSNRLSLASIFTTASTEFVIEQPFIGVTLALNGDKSGSVAVESGEAVDIVIGVQNTLEDTIYDGKVLLNLSGNALSDYQVEARQGHYDSINNQVRWDHADVSSLRSLSPGGKTELRLALVPDPDIKVTPQLAFDVDVRARRITEDNVNEELVGTAAGVAKVTTEASLLSEAARGTSVFTESGPLPPVAEIATTYTITLLAENGTNDISDTEITAALPSYVSWLDQTSGAGKITFNETSRTITWNAGDIDANQSKIASFQVSLLPSISQIGTTPTLVGEQRLRATDRFTDEVVRTNSNPLTTSLAAEAGYDKRIGEVRATEE